VRRSEKGASFGLTHVTATRLVGGSGSLVGRVASGCCGGTPMHGVREVHATNWQTISQSKLSKCSTTSSTRATLAPPLSWR